MNRIRITCEIKKRHFLSGKHTFKFNGQEITIDNSSFMYDSPIYDDLHTSINKAISSVDDLTKISKITIKFK